jgi:AcrR family transcriptional regulator
MVIKMAQTKVQTKQQILTAAFECFLQYGYSKSTLGDIAKKAGISRTSIYLYFSNKEDLFITMNKNLHVSYVAKSEEILKSDLSDREKLTGIIDVWIVDHYKKIKNTMYANDLLDRFVCISQQTERRFRTLFIKSIAPLIGGDVAEIVVLSLRGLMDDRPPAVKLQRRIELLVKAVT